MIDANSTYAAGSTGGSATHTHTTGDCTLTAAQSGVPAHSHGNTIVATTPSLSHSITQPAFTTPKLTHSITQPVLNNNGAHTHDIVSSENTNSKIYPANYSYSSSDGHVSNWDSRYTTANNWIAKSAGSHAHTLKTNVAVGDHAATACTRSTNVAVTAHAATACTMSGSISNNTATAASSAHNHGNTGSGSTIQPWVGVYMWKRTA